MKKHNNTERAVYRKKQNVNQVKRKRKNENEKVRVKTKKGKRVIYFRSYVIKPEREKISQDLADSYNS